MHAHQCVKASMVHNHMKRPRLARHTGGIKQKHAECWLLIAGVLTFCNLGCEMVHHWVLGLAPHLVLPLLVEVKQVVQCPVVDATPRHVLNLRARHGVGLTTAGLAVCKDAHIVACTHTQSSQALRSHRFRHSCVME